MPYLKAYQGDPGFLKSLVHKVTGLTKHIPGPAGFVFGQVHRATGRRAPAPPMGSMPGLGYTGGGAGAGGRWYQTQGGGKSGGSARGKGRGQMAGEKRRRRMNAANPRALRRAIRRQESFVKLARKALKGTGYVIKTRGSATSRRPIRIHEHGPGSVSVRG